MDTFTLTALIQAVIAVRESSGYSKAWTPGKKYGKIYTTLTNLLEKSGNLEIPVFANSRAEWEEAMYGLNPWLGKEEKVLQERDSDTIANVRNRVRQTYLGQLWDMIAYRENTYSLEEDNLAHLIRRSCELYAEKYMRPDPTESLPVMEVFSVEDEHGRVFGLTAHESTAQELCGEYGAEIVKREVRVEDTPTGRQVFWMSYEDIHDVRSEAERQRKLADLIRQAKKLGASLEEIHEMFSEENETTSESSPEVELALVETPVQVEAPVEAPIQLGMDLGLDNLLSFTPDRPDPFPKKGVLDDLVESLG